jgi:hypothetical protein
MPKGEEYFRRAGHRVVHKHFGREIRPPLLMNLFIVGDLHVSCDHGINVCHRVAMPRTLAR